MVNLGRMVAVVLAMGVSGCAWSNGALSPAQSGTEAQQPADPYEVGKAYFAQGQYGLALESFRAALRQSPDSARNLNGVAACYDRMLRFDLADGYYQQALALDPHSVQTLNNLGYSHYRRYEEGYGGEFLASAKDYLDRAKSLVQDNPVIADNIARVEAALTQQSAPAVAAPAPARGLQVVERDPYAAWIERRSPSELYLVTHPNAAAVALIRSLGVAPSIAALSDRDNSVNAPTIAIPIRQESAMGRATTKETASDSACTDASCRFMGAHLQRFLAYDGPVAGEIRRARTTGLFQLASRGLR